MTGLAQILAEAGTKVLAGIVEKRSPAAAVIVEKLGAALGTAGSPEAISDAYRADPGPVIAAAQEIEASDPAVWEYLAKASAGQAAMFAREDQRETFFSWGWRPALSWLLILLVIWQWLLLPVVNAAFGAAIPAGADIIAFAGIWLTIYGGGHTIKDVAAKLATAKGG